MGLLAAASLAACGGSTSDAPAPGDAGGAGLAGSGGSAAAIAGMAGSGAGGSTGGGKAFICSGVACASKLSGSYDAPVAGAHNVRIQIPGEEAFELTCPGNGKWDRGYNYQCTTEGFLLRGFNAGSPLAVDTPLVVGLRISQDAGVLFEDPATAFPVASGPYYDGGESPAPECGPTACWKHAAVIATGM